jgi:hypothetical protein
LPAVATPVKVTVDDVFTTVRIREKNCDKLGTLSTSSLPVVAGSVRNISLLV